MTDFNIVDELHRLGCSCVVLQPDGCVSTFHNRGVADLLRLVDDGRSVLKGSSVADKVVGKAAAALMICGGVVSVHADVISKPALALFEAAGVRTSYGLLVDVVRNRKNTDICPMEKACADVKTAAECLPVIRQTALMLQKASS